MKRPAFLVLCFAIATAACQDPTTAPAAERLDASFTLQSTTFAGPHLERGPLRLPAGAHMSHQQLAELVERAIDPADYQCNPSTPIFDWYLARRAEVATQEPAIYNLVYLSLAGDLVALYDAVLFQTDATPQYFGYNGEFTRVLEKAHRDVKRFWDIDSDGIQLIGLHGSMLLDVERVARVYNVVFGIPAPNAAVLAGLVRDALLASQLLNGGNHPLFSFNAFAVTGFGGAIPDKILMGDGILHGYAELGFGDVAAQAIHAHEFAHHIQYRNGYFDDPIATSGSQPEQTRYTELMADAMSAYYLTHRRGGTMNRKRVEQFLEVFFQLGDCAFANPSHHGTPNQRMAAARWGFDLADQAKVQGHILTAAQVYDLFVAAYPDLIAPDAR